MTQEQKAKAYDEALERAKSVIEQNPLMEYLKKGIEYIFPELKESEDERIRKSLLKYLHTLPNHYSHDGVCAPEWIDWLEKQGEHANFRNKIHIGDKVTRNRDGVLVNLSQLNRVTKVEEKQGEQKPTDEEMKELLQTEYEKGRADAIAEMQKSWNEKDEEQLNNIMWIIEAYRKNGFNETHIQIADNSENWLKSLKDRVHPHCIEKACFWLKNHYSDYMYNPTGERLEAFFGGDMCNDFENYMKGE